MKDIKKLHREAIALAKKAKEAQSKNNNFDFRKYSEEALGKELQATEELKDIFEAEPTRSVVFMTAATLANSIGLNRLAKQLLQVALEGKPYSEMKLELEKLLQEVLISIDKIEQVDITNQKIPKKVRIAILDLYEGHANQGMRCIREVITQWTEATNIDVELVEYELRLGNFIPDMSFDIYISSGGPGSPIDSIKEDWDDKWCNWLNEIKNWNADPGNRKKKHVFLIGHSFLLGVRFLNLSVVSKRKSTAFGIFPMYLLQDGQLDPIFDRVDNPFYAVDARDYQAIDPNYALLEKSSGKVLCLEKQRPHVPFERAIMALRFDDYIVGTHFHPEADARGLRLHLEQTEKKKTIIENYGEQKYLMMLRIIDDPQKLEKTQSKVLINFFNWASGISDTTGTGGDFPDPYFTDTDFNFDEIFENETLTFSY